MVKTAPNKEDFLHRLTFHASVTISPHMEQIVKEDMSQFINGLDRLLEPINIFYKEHDLDLQEMV